MPTTIKKQTPAWRARRALEAAGYAVHSARTNRRGGANVKLRDAPPAHTPEADAFWARAQEIMRGLFGNRIPSKYHVHRSTHRPVQKWTLTAHTSGPVQCPGCGWGNHADATQCRNSGCREPLGGGA